MKIFSLPPREDWICDRFVSEWNAGNPDMVSGDPWSADIVWLLADWCWNHIERSVLSQKKVVVTVHHIVPEKFGTRERDEFAARDQFVDLYHVPCHKTKKQIEHLTSKPIWVMPFWVNPSLWRKLDVVRSAIRGKCGLPVDKYLVGSFQRDTEGSDLKSPKLEKGPDQFCDVVEKIQKQRGDVHVVLAGWRRQYVMGRLDAAGIPYSYFHLPSFDRINELYNAIDLYVVAARYEGGPQSIVECVAAGTPIISTDVGLAEMILDRSDIFDMSTVEDALARRRGAGDVSAYLMPQGFDAFRKKFKELL